MNISDIIGWVLLILPPVLTVLFMIALTCMIASIESPRDLHDGADKITPEEVHEISERWRYKYVYRKAPVKMPYKSAGQKGNLATLPYLKSVSEPLIKRFMN
jgi:hypothetical protein